MSHSLYEEVPKDFPTKGVRAEDRGTGVNTHRAPGWYPADTSRKIPVRPLLRRGDEYCGTRFRSSRREARSIGTQPSNPASLPYRPCGPPIGSKTVPHVTFGYTQGASGLPGRSGAVPAGQPSRRARSVR
ncbi:hypothetical protein SNE510_26070 [Streptomyces sp. NE5-10]|nr:hypothetical protein SNE510_26070 [Streptomyces sp. NE5-10]